MLKVTELTKNYGKIQSVNSLNFEINNNEVVGLLGQNGAGKTTTMRMLSGFLNPTKGKIILNETDIRENPKKVKQQIGYLPEIPPLYTDMTVNEQLRFVSSLKDIPAKQVNIECSKVCDMLNISHVSKRVIGNLSKGYRQRVGFAAALIGNPSLLILDEPSVGLDPQQMVDIRNLIKNLAQQMSVIISSHILSEIDNICNRLIILNHGNLIASGSIDDIKNQCLRENIIHCKVEGNEELAFKILSDIFSNTESVVKKENDSKKEEKINHYVINSAINNNITAEIFKSFAKHSNEISILEMYYEKPTLEKIFMSITAKEEY